ncbi:MAG TPA: FliH/SctL family protein [Bryobacteraceae bacterium]|jgi:flagellar assembly protein FliH|nr:FliH/SctL family protein [Bryobacteraceae bacterium]
MSSKIVGSEIPGNDQPSATPVLWRMVASVSDPRRNSHGDAEREAARKLDQARRDAYAEGLAAGRQQAEDQFRPAVQGLADTLNTLARLRESIREETIQDLVHLATSIAGRVIHREVAVDPDALAGLIQAAFTKLQSREINRVRMHPTLEGLVRKLLEQVGAPKNLMLTADANLKPTEVFFETAQGILDASVETQLREIERGLIDKLER